MNGATPSDVIVIGGGLHGCSSALQLARRGRHVTVIERDRAGAHASGVNAGGVRRLNRHPAEIPLAVASLDLWHRIADLVGDDCGFRPSGQIRLAENAADLRKLEERVALVRDLGYEHERLIDRGEVRRRLPAAAPHVVGAILCEGDGFAEPYRTTLAFRRAATDLGVRFREGECVLGIDRIGDLWRVTTDRGVHEAADLANCAGAWAARLAAAVDEPVPLVPRALMMMVTARAPAFCEPVVGLASRKLSFKQSAQGTVVIGGGYEGTVVDDDTVLDFRGLAASARTVAEVFPLLRDIPIQRCWAGIEGFLPDEIPVISTSRHAGLVHAFGYCGHGFELGPVAGSIVADLVIDGKSRLPIDAFRIDRFSSPGPKAATP
jgi:sarcosine oxidase subunit beta